MSKFLLLLLTISPIAIKAFGQGTDALADSTIKFAEQKLSYLNEQLRKHPNDITLTIRKSRILGSINKREEAISILSSLLNQTKKKSTVYIERGKLYVIIGKYDSAKLDFIKASQFTGLPWQESYEAYWRLGNVNFLRGDYQNSVRAFDSAFLFH